MEGQCVGLKISIIGWLFALLLVIPGMCEKSNIDPPILVKAIVLIPGFLGLLGVFIGFIITVLEL
jgi:hypothetical protein